MAKTILSRTFKAPQKGASLKSQLARTVVFKLLGAIKTDALVIHERGQHYVFGDESSELVGVLEVHDPSVYAQILSRGDIGLGEAFMRGDISSPNTVNVVRVLVRQQAMFKQLARYNIFAGLGLDRVKHFLRKNNLRGSKRNITAHYDLGNEFFQTFLDPTMMYSSAVYESADTPLEVASVHKLHTVCEALKLSENDHLLEIGTGWGALAVYAAKHYGCKVTTTTISQAQYERACEKVEQEGVAHLVTVLDQDYRKLQGQFDKLVSIEMIEAVGHQYLSGYLRIINDRLKPGGLAVLQAIMLPDQKYDRARFATDFIKTHIFPGGFLPSPAAILADTKKGTALNLVNYKDITQSYAYTLRDWQTAFNENDRKIDELGYPAPFRRLWRFYLSYCEGAFEEHAIYCGQFTFEKNRWL